MLVAALRQRILELAIQGKLVPQSPEDGTAEELYQQIQQEKKKLIAAGKLKKEKPLPPISEDEIPFDIPESWKWVRLGDVFEIITGKTPSKGDIHNYTPAVVPFYKPADIGQALHIGEAIQQVSEKGSLSAPLLPKGAILVSCIGSIGKCAIIDKEGICNQQINAVIPSLINIEYCLCVLRSEYAVNAERDSSRATTIAILNKQKFSKICIPLPTLAEQRRIAEKVCTLFAELDAIEQSQEKVAAIQTELNKRILERAIQGKLVPQRPEEGTAEELYQQIQKEKKKLIVAGKLKKEKPLPPISEDEIPFDIPESWKWVHMGDVFAHNTGKAQNSTAETRNGILRKFITTSNVYWNRFDFSKVKEMLFTEKEIEKCSVQKGDLLVCEGGDCGRAAIWQDDESMCIQNHIHRLHPYVGVDIMFFYYVFLLLKQKGHINGKGVGIKGLSSNTLHKLPCPLPPLKEQRRIVEKIEKCWHSVPNK